MAWQTFYSYSHTDEQLRDRLAIQLAPLKRNGKIIEWHDRRIEPGTNWDAEISKRLESAHLVLMLLSPEFLASDYCFGVEVERCIARVKAGSLRLVPILLKKCLWGESPFSELQIIPRDGRAISSASSPDEAWNDVALEISKLVLEPPPAAVPPIKAASAPMSVSAVDRLDLMRGQVRSFARLYERTRQRMEPGFERTQRMETVLRNMRALALGYYPLLQELVDSPSPGERLAAVAVLQVVASQKYLPFLVKTVGSDKPFVGYHAVQALRFAVSALEPAAYPALTDALTRARAALREANARMDSDRWHVLDDAVRELETISSSLLVSEIAARDRPEEP